jgi:threonine aldolase
MRRIDLRSDIVSASPAPLLDVLHAAAGRPRVFGMREDTDQQVLEALSAQLLGMESALFFPTCTMANQVALMLSCPPGTYVLAEATTHLCGTEGSSTAGVAGTPVLGLEGHRGHPTPAEIADALGRPRREAEMRIGLLWLENTHNFAGGTVMPMADFHAAIASAGSHATPVHVDGSRLWNAVAFHGVAPAEVVRGARSVSFSLNKALGAPMGAMLVGSTAFIGDAVRVRQMLGGGWRPPGFLAAAGAWALEHMTGRVAQDHARAIRLADGLAALGSLGIDRGSVETNIVVAQPAAAMGPVRDVVAALAERGVLVIPHGGRAIRMVLHRDIDDEAVSEVVTVFRNFA